MVLVSLVYRQADLHIRFAGRRSGAQLHIVGHAANQRDLCVHCHSSFLHIKFPAAGVLKKRQPRALYGHSSDAILQTDWRLFRKALRGICQLQKSSTTV